jgi:hypothetical protein
MASQSSQLAALAELLRDARTLLSPLVRDPEQDCALGALAAAGPRAASAPEEYTLLVEAIREGYLLHYGTPRLIDGADQDLRLLAGDYLYALGLERLAARGDLDAVRELADLISLSAKVYADDGDPAEEPQATRALWLAAAVAVGAGPTEDHRRAKRALREGDLSATRPLIENARETAAAAGMGDALARAADSIGFAGEDLPDRG